MRAITVVLCPGLGEVGGTDMKNRGNIKILTEF